MSSRLYSTTYQATTNSRSKSTQTRAEGSYDLSAPPEHGWREAMGVAVILGCLVLGMLGSMAGWYAWVHGDVQSNTKTTTYTVRASDTAWTIASKDTAYGTGQVEQWIEDRYGDDLQPGQVIRIPIGGK